MFGRSKKAYEAFEALTGKPVVGSWFFMDDGLDWIVLTAEELQEVRKDHPDHFKNMMGGGKFQRAPAATAALTWAKMTPERLAEMLSHQYKYVAE